MPILSTSPPIVRPRFAGPRYASWQEAMKDAVRDVDELCRLLDLPADFAAAARDAAQQFRLFVPRGFLARMRPGDSTDPLLRQGLPVADEKVAVPGFTLHPVRGDLAQRQPAFAGPFPTMKRRARSPIGNPRLMKLPPTTQFTRSFLAAAIR